MERRREASWRTPTWQALHHRRPWPRIGWGEEDVALESQVFLVVGQIIGIIDHISLHLGRYLPDRDVLFDFAVLFC